MTSVDVRLSRLTIVVVFVATVVVTVGVVRREPSFSMVGTTGAALAVEIGAAVLLVAAALATRAVGSPFRVLLAAVAAAWLVGEWSSPAAGAAFTPGLVLYAAWPPMLAWAALKGLDDERLDRPSVVVLSVAFGSGVGILGLLTAMVFDPLAQGCGSCPDNLVLVSDAAGWGKAFSQAGLAVTPAWVAAYAVVAGARVARSSPARRRSSAPVLVPAVATLLLWAVQAVHGLGRGYVSNDAIDQRLRLAEAVGLALVAGGVALTRWRARRTRTALARLVLDIGEAPKPGEVRTWLAASLGDPTLTVLYRLEGEEWIDAEGRAASLVPPAGREVTRVRNAGDDLLAVVHRRGLLDDPTLLAELVTTARLALEHDRLHAGCRGRIEQLRASRARIVAEADLRRRELERDLHDGAQQRLVAAALAVRLMRRGLPEGNDELEQGLAAAEAGVREAVVALRDVAHGLFPAVLADEGLAAALDELSEHDPRLVPGAVASGRFPGEVESAAYFATLESLRLTDDGVTVDVLAEDNRLRLVISAGAPPTEALVQILDRVGAVGGTMAVTDGQLRVEMPCAS
jgi:signal transduction histidine kinase